MRSTRHRAPVNHTGGHSPSQVSCRLRSVGHVASGSSPRSCIVGSRLPPGPSFRGVLPRFRGYEGRSDPLSADAECSQFGTVSDRAYRQAVSRLSWLSYLPSGFSPERRPESRAGPCRHRQRAPHAGQVERTSRDFHPNVPQSGYGPNPLGGIFTLLDDYVLELAHEVFPCRPSSEEPQEPYRIEHRDWSRRVFSQPPNTEGGGSTRNEDYADEPPSNRTSHSHGIRLYGSAPVRVVNAAPLAEVVNHGLPGGTAHLSDVSNAPRL